MAACAALRPLLKMDFQKAAPACRVQPAQHTSGLDTAAAVTQAAWPCTAPWGRRLEAALTAQLQAITHSMQS